MPPVRIDSAALRTLLRSQDGPVGRELLKRGNRVVNRAKGLCPVGKTGRLRNNITAHLAEEAGSLVCLVGTDVEYARFVHDGTGVEGPLKRRIDVGHVMRWTSTSVVVGPRGGKSKQSSVVFAMSTQGVKPRPFLKDAMSAAR